MREVATRASLPAGAVAALVAALVAGTIAVGAGCRGEPRWSVAAGPLPQMLLSVWGTGGRDVWVVGGGCDPADCQGSSQAAILHFDGTWFNPVESPVPAVLWWVFGFSPRDVWVAGEQGTILHFDGTAFAPVTSGAEDPDHKKNVKLFGIWGAAPDDIYAAGGVPDASSTVLHYDGASFSPVAGAPAIGGAWYKVWGSARDDVYLVGQLGSAAHYDGHAWTLLDLSGAGVTSRDRLFTAAGRSRDDVYLVGGDAFGQGIAIHKAGDSWSAIGAPFDGVPLLTGVFEDAAGDVVITGLGGAKLAGRDGTWRNDSPLAPLADLHAVWLDAEDDVFAAGGDFFSLRSGIVARYAR